MAVRPHVPDWFVPAFEQALAKLGWKLLHWKDQGAVLLDAEGKESYYGLDNVLRKAANAAEPDRTAKIIEHFGNLSRFVEESSLGGARERLLPRLKTPVDDPAISGALWSMPFHETGALCTLAIDQPTSMQFVTRSMIEKSERPAEDWWRLALDNLRLISNKSQIVEVDDSGLLGIGIADSYDASRALLLDELAPPDPRGHMASIPNRDRFFFYAVGEDPFDQRFVRLLINTLEEYQSGAYSIIDTIFWVHEGKWHAVEWERNDEGGLSVSAPPEMEVFFDD